METIKRPSQLVIIRHAESARNKAKQDSTYFTDDDARATVKGIPDHKIPITPHGHNQAVRTGTHLHKHFALPDYIYHSGYERTVQTLDCILKAYSQEELDQIRIRMNPFIRERDPGFAYDMTTEEAEMHFPYLKEYWQTFGGFFARPPGGESLADVIERVYTFLNMLFRDRAGQKAWVVIHGGTIKAFRFLLERWNYDRAMKWAPGESPENCGVTTYEYDKSQGRLVLKEYNAVFWK